MELHRIADDLDGHIWYAELLEQTVADVEAFAARWADFHDVVAGFGDGEPASDEA